MKILFLACLLFTFVASAEDLSTKSGKIYRDIAGKRATAFGLSFTHESGAATVPYADLPDEMQEEYKEFKEKISLKTEKKASAVPSSVPSTSSRETIVTEKKASAVPSSTTSVSSTGSGARTTYTGPRGGTYYINKNGNKTYIKKK